MLTIKPEHNHPTNNSPLQEVGSSEEYLYTDVYYIHIHTRTHTLKLPPK